MRTKNRALVGLALLIAIPLAIWVINPSLPLGVGGDFRRSLVNGYYVFRTNSSTCVIMVDHLPTSSGFCAPHNVAVAALVDRMAVIDRFVIGHVADSPESELFANQKVGYFILDTAEHSVKAGLDEQQWLRELNALGIKDIPTLKSPRRLH